MTTKPVKPRPMPNPPPMEQPSIDEEREPRLRSTAGAWQKNDAYWERVQREIYEARRSGSRSLDWTEARS